MQKINNELECLLRSTALEVKKKTMSEIEKEEFVLCLKLYNGKVNVFEKAEDNKRLQTAIGYFHWLFCNERNTYPSYVYWQRGQNAFMRNCNKICERLEDLSNKCQDVCKIKLKPELESEIKKNKGKEVGYYASDWEEKVMNLIENGKPIFDIEILESISLDKTAGEYKS